MHENEDEQILKKLQQLQNFALGQEGLLVGSDFKGVLVKVQELQHALFQRQHMDVQMIIESVELTRSSHSVEKLTRGLIILTIALSILTGLDVLKFLG